MADKTTRELLYNSIKDTAGVKFVDENFSLPQDCDFMTESFSMDLYNSLNQTKNDMAFYLETPFSTTPGYYETEEVFLVKAAPYVAGAIDTFVSTGNKEDLKKYCKEAESLNKNDGDTVYFMTDTLQSGNSGFNLGNATYNSFETLVNKTGAKNNSFGVRFLGLNTPEIPHYSSVPILNSDLTKNQFKIKDIEGFSNYVYSKYNENGYYKHGDTVINFYHDSISNKYYEIVDNHFQEGYNNLTQEEINNLNNNQASLCKIVYSDSSDQNVANGLKQKETVESMLSQAEDIVIMLDYKSLSKKTNNWETPYNIDYFESGYNTGSAAWTFITKKWNEFFSKERYRYIGYGVFGQDNNNRFLGAVYIKVSLPELGGDSVWINLNKYIIQKYSEELEILPDYTSDPRQQLSNGFCSDAFKLWTYDFLNMEILDAFTSYTDVEDNCVKNRNEVLNIVTGNTFQYLKKHTVVIGDTAFVVPPTSIRCVTQNQTESVKMLRSRGSAIKNMPKSEKVIELKLYFNDSSNINGTPYEVTYPNGKKATYYMNGLRALIAQFRLTPFLPIENEYINDVQNVFGVTMLDLQVNTIPGFPKCLQATLTLQEFNYRMYMPELPLPNEMESVTDITTNPFARTIHYPIMRYYYQRLLQKGNNIKNYEFNSDEYLNATFGSQTALIPMDFKDPTVEFYLPDTQWLDKRLQAAIEKETVLKVNYEFTDAMKDIIAQMAPAYRKMEDRISDKGNDLYKYLDELTEPVVMRVEQEEKIYDYDSNSYIMTNELPMRLSIKSDFLSGMEVIGGFSYNTGELVGILPKACLNFIMSATDAEGNILTQKPADAGLRWLYYEDYDDLENVQVVSGSTRRSVEILEDIVNSYVKGIGETVNQNLSVKSKMTGNTATVDISFAVQLPQSLLNEQERNIFRKKVSTTLEIADEDLFLLSDNGALCIKVPITFNFKLRKIDMPNSSEYYTESVNYSINSSSPGMKFLKYCELATKQIKDENGNIIYLEFEGDTKDNMSEELDELNEDNFIEDGESIKFVKYEIGEDLRIESMNCVYSNSVSRVTLNALDGYAYQYCGGQDIVIEMKITTKDQVAVSLLSNLPRIASQMVIDYKMILANWPLRVNSEITKLFGVNEVLIESVDTSTVPNYPGLYLISLRFISVDRSTRNRETLKRIEGINDTGPINNGNAYNMKTFFDIRNTLGKAEIYPDLELPTIDEIEKLGYKITRYYSPDDNTRKFVDPDFYFVYAHQLTHEIFRSGLMRIFKNHKDNIQGLTGIDNNFVISDRYGAKNIISYGEQIDNIPYESQPANDIAVAENAASQANKSNKILQNSVQIRNDIYNGFNKKALITSQLATQLTDLKTPIWSISSPYIFPLREKTYELATYENANNNSEINKSCLENITEFSNLCLETIEQELQGPINLKDNLNIENFTVDKFDKETIVFPETNLKWAETRLENFINEYNNKFNFFKQLSSEEVADVGKKEITKLFKAYADAMTGYSYCNEVKTFITNPTSTDEDELSKINWKFKMFLNTSDIMIGKNDNDSDLESIIKPYCKVFNKQDSTVLFAESLNDAVENGYAFGMFQISMINKANIMQFIFSEQEMKAIKSSNNLEFFFIDPYYRNLQITDPGSEELKTYKRQLLIDPAFAAYALVRNMMVWYKKLIKDEIAISVFETFKREANEFYSSEKAKQAAVAAAGMAAIGSGGYVSPSLMEQLDDNGVNLSSEIKKNLEENMTVYIEAFVSKYHSFYTGDSEAFTDQGLIENAVPEDLKDFVKKGSDKTTELLTKYNEMKTRHENGSAYEEDLKESILETLIAILEAENTSVLTSYGTLIVGIKKELEEQISLNLTAFDKIKEQLTEESKNIIIGKVFGLSMLSMGDGYKIYDLLKNRNTTELDTFMMTLPLADSSNTNIIFKKFIMALDGRDLIKNELLGKKAQTAEELVKIAAAERVYISRSNNINEYLKDSFLDMIQTDKRGRMVRAFPTYYMIFIDEGRKIGLWKLHDNFYNMNAISEITVTKSRKIAADTAQIQMSNMFKTFSQDDPQRDYDLSQLNTVRYNMRDAFNSIFSPRTYYMKEEIQRQMQEIPRSTQLQPGIRIHIRMGYSANAADLPIMFNGVIAEVGTSDIVNIVAQGDGVELLNPIFSTDDAEDVQNQSEFIFAKWMSNWLTNGATPKQILTSILSAKGTWLQSQIRTVTMGRFFNSNPYGISHFGDPYYTNIFASGEPAQNIYEANPRATYGKGYYYNGLEQNYDTGETPNISMHIYGKTFWDIMHVCASAQPDFIASIVPFGMRSSVFYGNGRSYYAYDYIQQSNKNFGMTTIEKRKPFQQQHVFTSYTDIIYNNISASSKNIKTCAVGLYQATMLAGADKTYQTEPLYVDFDIYPEYQKSMTVDTQLWAKGLPVLGNLFGITQALDKDVSDRGITGAKEIAWRMTASALKNSMKDMYDGEITVIGYPAIKPYDRMWISDTYERMEGQSEVEAVVHTFNTATGFTTSIYADCISVIDDMYEQYGANLLQQGVGMSVATVTANIIPKLVFDKSGRPLVASMVKRLSSATSGVVGIVENTAKLLDFSTFNLSEKILTSGESFAGNLTGVSLKNIFTRTGIKKFFASSAVFAIEMVAFEVMGAYCSEWIYRYLQNLQVLQIYPMKRKGRVMVAGLNGHKGVVVGSPTEKQQGDWTNFCISMFDGKDPGLAEGLIDFMFGTDQIKNMANSLRRDADMPPIDTDDSVSKEQVEQAILSDLADIYISQSYENRRAILNMPRIESMGPSSEQYMKLYKIDCDDDIAKSYDLTKKTFPIQEENNLQKYFNIDFIDIFNEKEIGNTEVMKINFNGKEYDMEYYKNSSGIIIVPTLRFEAMVVLIDCIDLLAKKFNITDMNTKINTPEVYITSATVLGGPLTWESSGYSFRIQIASYDKAENEAFAKEVIDYYKQTYNINNLLTYKQIDGSKEILFVVKPVKSKLFEEEKDDE